MEETDFQDLLNGIWKRKLVIILLIILFLSLGILYNFKKSKKSLNEIMTNASFIIVRTEDFPLTDKITGTCEKIIKTNNNLEYVIEKLSLELEKEELSNMLSLKRVDESDVFEISLKGDAENSTEIVSEILNLLNIQLKEIYDINDIYVIETPKQIIIPSDSHINKKTMVIFALAGMIFGVIVAAGLELFDSTLKNKNQLLNSSENIVELSKKSNKEIELEKLKMDLKNDKSFLVSFIDSEKEKNCFMEEFIKVLSNSKKIAFVSATNNELTVFEILNSKKEKIRKYDECLEELIKNDKLKSIFESLKKEFDTIIVDSNSILTSVITLKISELTDRTILVFKMRKTKIKDIKIVFENMKKFRAKKITIVVEND